MADIVYKIEFDEDTGLSIEKSIERIGVRDRIRFMTTKETAKEYKIALRRDRKKSRLWPFKADAVEDPYMVPLETEKPQWITVVRSGRKHQFHYDCGVIEDGEFVKFQPEDSRNPPRFFSLPFPD